MDEVGRIHYHNKSLVLAIANQQRYNEPLPALDPDNASSYYGSFDTGCGIETGCKESKSANFRFRAKPNTGCDQGNAR